MTPPARHGYVVVVATVAGMFHLGTGVWALASPRSFYDQVATFPPYNHHLLHDIGAFLLGLGVVLIAALVWRDGLCVALLGGTVAAMAHVTTHVADYHLGGAPRDLWGLGALAVVLAVALVLRLPARRGAADGTTDPPRTQAPDGRAAPGGTAPPAEGKRP